MTDDVERALVTAVRANPDDWDTLRVFADWLAEQGDVRGELVPLEHQLATALTPDERGVLMRRIKALEEAHREAWLAGWVPPEGVRLDWRHGFVFGVRLPWNDDTLAVLAQLLAHPVGALLTRLDLQDNGIGAEGARALASSDHLRSLQMLNLKGNGIGTDGARALAHSDTLGSLTVLSLENNGVGDEGVRALAAADNLPSLKALGLAQNGIGAEGAHALASSDNFPSLRVLDLRENGIGVEGACALATSDTLRSLARLNLSNNNIGVGGARALAASDNLRSLTKLFIWGNDLSDDGKAALAASEVLRGCTVSGVAWPRSQRDPDAPGAR